MTAPVAKPKEPYYPTPPRDKVQAWMDAKAPADWYYILPMAVFLLLLSVPFDGFEWPMRLGQLLIVGGLLIWTWPRLTAAERTWDGWLLGIVVGVVGLVQWIGMDKLLRAVPWLSWTYYRYGPGDPESFMPDQFATTFLLVTMIVVRMGISVIVVAFMEEIFWRNFLWRTLASPNNMHRFGVGQYDPLAFFGTACAFALVHPQWLVAIGYGLLMSLLLWKTKSLGSVIIAHAVTNGLLWAYVLIAWYGFGYDQWYFW